MANHIENSYSKPHRRFNPLTGEWILVSPHRTQRPWQGRIEDTNKEKQPQYDPTCYLCPGNDRAGGAVNPGYQETFVFTNDYAVLLPDTPENNQNENDLFVAESERGICRVVCFSPRHDLTLANMETADIRRVVDVWAAQYDEIGAVDFIKSVQIFENRGAMMGASNPHPHGQIWANELIPNEMVKELKSFRSYFEKHRQTLLSDYLEAELEKGERIVHENNWFAALIPFWAVYPFETLIISRRQTGSISELSNEERDGLADILRETAYDGFSSKTDRRTRVSRISFARAFLSAAFAFGDDSQIYGRLRIARFAATRHHARNGGGNVTQSESEIIYILSSLNSIKIMRYDCKSYRIIFLFFFLTGNCRNFMNAKSCFVNFGDKY